MWRVHVTCPCDVWHHLIEPMAGVITPPPFIFLLHRPPSSRPESSFWFSVEMLKWDVSESPWRRHPQRRPRRRSHRRRPRRCLRDGVLRDVHGDILTDNVLRDGVLRDVLGDKHTLGLNASCLLSTDLNWSADRLLPRWQHKDGRLMTERKGTTRRDR